MGSRRFPCWKLISFFKKPTNIMLMLSYLSHFDYLRCSHLQKKYQQRKCWGKWAQTFSSRTTTKIKTNSDRYISKYPSWVFVDKNKPTTIKKPTTYTIKMYNKESFIIFKQWLIHTDFRVTTVFNRNLPSLLYIYITYIYFILEKQL